MAPIKKSLRAHLEDCRTLKFTEPFIRIHKRIVYFEPLTMLLDIQLRIKDSYTKCYKIMQTKWDGCCNVCFLHTPCASEPVQTSIQLLTRTLGPTQWYFLRIRHWRGSQPPLLRQYPLFPLITPILTFSWYNLLYHEKVKKGAIINNSPLLASGGNPSPPTTSFIRGLSNRMKIKMINLLNNLQSNHHRSSFYIKWCQKSSFRKTKHNDK